MQMVKLGDEAPKLKMMPTIKSAPAPKPKVRSRRLRYMGKNPGKKSRTGRQVIERMRREGKITGKPPKEELRFTDPRTGATKKYPLSECDMAHEPTAAVSWWNQGGYKFGPKSPEARKFMLDPDNYELQPSWFNRSQGARMGETYRDIP